MNLTPPAPPARPASHEPERSTFTAPIRPVVIKPIERIERTYIERIPEEREPHTEPVPVAPIVERIVIVTQPEERMPDAERQPPRSHPWPEKERTPDPAQSVLPRPTNRTDAPRTPTPDRERGAAPEQKEFDEPNKNSSPEPAQRVRKPNKKSSPINSESIRQTIPNNSEPELISPDTPAPQADASGFKKVGKVGRQRRYDELGIDDIEPIKEVVLFRHQMGRHWPGLSKDMEAYYEQMYFTRPNKRKDGKDYDKHCKCWERRERWLGATGATQAQSA